MGEKDGADDRFPPRLTWSEVALLAFVAVLVAVSIGLVVAKLLPRP
jgi:hypothetical protein